LNLVPRTAVQPIAEKTVGKTVSGVNITHRITEESFALLKEEREARNRREAAYTPMGKLISEAVVAHYGPKHDSLLKRLRARKGA
jgi:hypothetical protein